MRKSSKIMEIEKRYNMEYKEILEMLYIKEKKSLKQIAKEFGCDSGNLSRQFKKYGIETRKGREAFQNWWDNTDDRETFLNNSRNIAKTVLNSEQSRERLRKTMQTKEYKEKMSKANSGKRNGKYKEDKTEVSRVKERGIFGYKKWSKLVKERDDYTCCVCGKQSREPKKMVAHHLESYDTNEELRLDLDNGITVCASCHNKFHNKYRLQKTTKEQFEEFLKEEHL